MTKGVDHTSQCPIKFDLQGGVHVMCSTVLTAEVNWSSIVVVLVVLHWHEPQCCPTEAHNHICRLVMFHLMACFHRASTEATEFQCGHRVASRTAAAVDNLILMPGESGPHMSPAFRQCCRGGRRSAAAAPVAANGAEVDNCVTVDARAERQCRARNA